MIAAWIGEKVEEELDERWKANIVSVSPDDLLVVPADTPDEELARLFKAAAEFGIRGIIAASDVQVIKIK